MKKILISIVIVLYTFCSFMFIEIFTKLEFLNIIQQNKITFNLKSNLPANETLNILEDLSTKYNLNLVKQSYIPLDNKEKIIFFAAIPDPTSFYKNIIIDKGTWLDNSFEKKFFISSLESDDPNQIGKINLIIKENILEVRRLLSADKENIDTDYEIYTDDKNIAEKFIYELTQNTSISANIKYTPKVNPPINTSIITLVLSLIILNLICVIYYFMLNLKTFSVKKLMGFSDRKIRLDFIKQLIKINLIISSISCLTLIILGIFLFKTQNIFFYTSLIIFFIILNIILLFLYYISIIIIYNVDIKLMLKNKKPLKQLQFINYFSKIIFTTITIFIVSNIITESYILLKQNQNLPLWESTKDYAFTTVNNVDTSDENYSYNIGIKTKEFFKYIDDKDAIFIQPNQYYYNFNQENMEPISDDDRYIYETIEINQNYLTKHPIKDINNNIILEPPHKEDEITVLIPEKYILKKDNIEKEISESYQEIRYFDENLYLESIGKPKITQTTTVNFIYVKDNQKYFTYNPEVSEKNNNFIIDPIVYITNPLNRGTDSYFSTLTYGGYLFKTDNIQNPYKDIFPILKNLELENIVLSTPSLYSRIGKHLYTLKSNIASSFLIGILSLIIFFAISVFTTLNYAEKDKVSNAIKLIHGYSYFTRYKNYISFNLLLNIIISISIFSINKFSIISIIISSFSIIILDLFCQMICLKVNDLRNVKKIIKGG
ncbi:MAG: DUF1430 domain-containing protein [Oscillospiraceae bacterium]|nr:DUF1430 domain-containing protein [Oscillospiraceae bacterium]